MALSASKIPSRIGKGRPSSASTHHSASDTYTADNSTPSQPQRSTGIPLTPSALVTTEACTQQMPAQTGHNAATPVININAGSDIASPSTETPAATGSKWKSSGASSTGPVFSVVSRGNRLPASNSTAYTPPAPPTKAHGTIARTAARPTAVRSSPNSSTGSSGIGLRGTQRASSNLSSSSNSSATTVGQQFSSKIGTGRLNSSTSSISSSARSCATPVVASDCKSIARVLTFEDGAGSPAASPARPIRSISSTANSSAKPTTAAAVATAPASKLPLLSASASVLEAAPSGTVDDVVQQLDQLTNNSSNSTTWLSGANSTSSPLSELEASSVATAADLFSMHSNPIAAAAAATPVAPLPPVTDTASAQAAAKILLGSILDSISIATNVAGIRKEAALAALLGDNNNSTGSATAGSQGDPDDQSNNSSSSSGMGQMLLIQAAAMLEAEASAEQVSKAVMPALLLLLASLAVDSSSITSAAAGNAKDDNSSSNASENSATAAAAAEEIAAGVQAGLAAATAAVQGYGATAHGSHSTDAAPPAAAAVEGSSGSAKQRQRTKTSCANRAFNSMLFLLWSCALLVVGFVAAAALSVLEGQTFFESASGFCAVGPGGRYAVAAELCGGVSGSSSGVWSQEVDGTGWGAAAVQHSRRFGAAQV